MDINTVIKGSYLGKKIISSFGNVIISTSTFGGINIDKRYVDSINVISEKQDNEGNSVYEIRISFLSDSDEESIIYVDEKIYNILIKTWPQKRKDRLKELLSQDYKIVGYSSYFLGSAFGTSTIIGQSIARMQRQHNILLQKDTNVELVTIIEESIDGKMVERNRMNFVFSPIDN